MYFFFNILSSSVTLLRNMSMKYRNDLHCLSMLNVHLSPDTVSPQRLIFLRWAVHYPSRIKEQVFFKLSFYPQGTWSCAHFGQHLRQQQHNWVDLSCKLLLRECKNASDLPVPARTSVMGLHQVGPGWKGVPTKVALSLPSSFGHQIENVMKGSWIEIRTCRDHSPVTVTGKTDFIWGNELNLLTIKSE